jgi:two-component system chemotaxis response regulator CheB
MMPLTALNRTSPDHVVNLTDMPALLDKLVREPAGHKVPAPHTLRYEVEIPKDGRSNMNAMDNLGRRSVLSCPDCGGVMWEIHEGDLARYRCHVGHTYTAVMSLALDENLRRALGSAQRALEERVALARKLHDQAADKGQNLLAQTWSERMREFERELKVVRDGMQRMEQIAAASEQAAQRAAE